MKEFFKTAHCTSHVHCTRCRDLKGGRCFRERIAGIFNMPEIDWECPYGFKWIEEKQLEEILENNPQKWFLTVQCRSRINCSICRDEELSGWRKGILRLYPETAPDEHFDCPYGVPWLKK